MYIEEAFRRNDIPPQKMKAQVFEIVLQILKSAIDNFHRKGKVQQKENYLNLYKSLVKELEVRGEIDWALLTQKRKPLRISICSGIISLRVFY